MKKAILFFSLLLFCMATFAQLLAPNGIKIGKKTSTTAVTIDSASVIDGKYRLYKAGTVLEPVNPNPVQFSTIGVYKADTSGTKQGSYTSRYDFKNEYTNDNLIRGLNEVGWGIKYLPFADFAMGSGNAITDARQYLTACRITDTTLLTGVKFAVSVQGVYTGDAVNSVALYKYNGTSWDKVAETANDIELWKVPSGAGVPITKAFSTTYIATPGWYYIAHLYNSSAQTTAPSLYSMEGYQAWIMDMLGIKICGYIAAQASHAANITNASITRNTIPFLFMIY